MITLDSYQDVLMAVVQHVEETGHQDIRLHEDVRAHLTGYCCNNCPPTRTEGWYMAPVSTVLAIKGKYKDIDLRSTLVRGSLAKDLIKAGLSSRGTYRPTSWERILR